MCKLALFLAVWCTGVLVWQASEAEAQVGVSRYESPAGPTISPYLDYFRRDTGLLNRHHAFVRPQIEMQRSVRQLQQTSLQQQVQLGNLRGQLQTLRESTAAPTGTGSRFMDYSHYYRLPAAPTAPR